MGGYGSGRRGWRGVLDDYRQLDVNWLLRKGYLGRFGSTMLTWRDGDGSETGSIGVDLLRSALELHYTLNPRDDDARDMRYRVEIAWTQCHYGGDRPWFRCPAYYCGRRAGKLYLYGGYFVCRHCTRSAYASQNETQSDRLMRKARRIRTRLGASMDLSAPIRWKPKGMHWRTFERLRREEEQANYTGLVLAVRRFGLHYAL